MIYISLIPRLVHLKALAMGLIPCSVLHHYSTLASRVCAQLFSHVRLFATPWTTAHHTSRSMEFSRHEPWIGLPFPSPGDLPNSGIEPRSLASPSLAGGFFTTEPLGKPQTHDFTHTQILRCRVYMYTLVYIMSSLREARSSNSSETMSRPNAQILVS